MKNSKKEKVLETKLLDLIQQDMNDNSCMIQPIPAKVIITSKKIHQLAKAAKAARNT